MSENGNIRAPFKITIPITRAIIEDGGLFIEGEASGPEVDAFDTRMTPDLIEDFARQIVTRKLQGDPLLYTDTHSSDGVLTDLGELVAGSVNERGHLMVRVRLDEENPAAKHLHRQLSRGKQFGMSIGGSVIDYVDEFVDELHRVVRTFKRVALLHIANTTMPAWTPSLGTVLARAVDQALQGGTMPEVTPTPAASPEPVTEPTSATVAEQPKPEAVPAPAPAPAPEAAAPIVERNESVSVPASVLEQLTSLLASFMIKPESTPAPAETPEGEPVTRVETPVESPELVALRAELQRASARITELEATPATSQPPVVERAVEDAQELLRDMSPHSRLLIGLQAAHAAKNK